LRGYFLVLGYKAEEKNGQIYQNNFLAIAHGALHDDTGHYRPVPKHDALHGCLLPKLFHKAPIGLSVK
jgi:hypothetical protein